MRTFWPIVLFTVAAFLVPHAVWAQSVTCIGATCFPAPDLCPPSGCPPIPVLPVGGDYAGSNYGNWDSGGLTTIYIDPSLALRCVGDCDGDGKVSVNEIVLGVNIAMGNAPATRCPTRDGPQTISVLTSAVANSLGGCPPE